MSTYKGQTPARRKANKKYLTEKVDSINVRLPKGTKAVIENAATKKSKSLSQYCSDAIMDYLRSDPDAVSDCDM